MRLTRKCKSYYLLQMFCDFWKWYMWKMAMSLILLVSDMYAWSSFLNRESSFITPNEAYHFWLRPIHSIPSLLNNHPIISLCLLRGELEAPHPGGRPDERPHREQKLFSKAHGANWNIITWERVAWLRPSDGLTEIRWQGWASGGGC